MRRTPGDWQGTPLRLAQSRPDGRAAVFRINTGRLKEFDHAKLALKKARLGTATRLKNKRLRWR